jgi:histidine triad (HIT) family protein
VYADDDCVAFLPHSPATWGHTLVVPRDHVADFFSIQPAAASRLSSAVLTVAAAVRAAVHPDGMNLVTSAGHAAQQTVPHLHVHVVPRTTGDRIGTIWPSDEPIAADAAEQLQSLIASAVRRLQP